MNALDELMAEFNGAAGSMPAVNPPEASKVLETQTKPEVAGEPEPPEVETATAPPTEKPADVKAAEAAKARKPRGSKAAPAATPAPDAEPLRGAAGPAGEIPVLNLAELAKLAACLPKGVTLTITGGQA